MNKEEGTTATVVENNIMKIAKRKGVTRVRMAEELGVSRTHVYKAIKNPGITLTQLMKLANVLEVAVEDFLYEDENNGDGMFSSGMRGLGLESLQLVPFLETPASAGHGFGNLEINTSNVKGAYKIAGAGKLDFILEVVGDSMEPKYMRGDRVGCEMVDSESVLQYGKAYAILTKTEGTLIKRVKKSDDEGFVILKSDNNNYDDFRFSKDEIISIARVKCTVRLD